MRLAEIAQRAGDDQAGISERVLAAETWSAASRPDRALSNAEQALSRNPANGEARCWWQPASCSSFGQRRALILSGNGSTRNQRQEARQQLSRALQMADDVAHSKSTDNYDSNRAWAYYLVTSASAHCSADFDGEPSRYYHWKALQAELEALLLQPDIEGDWLRLADAAVELELWSLAELGARTAVSLSLSPQATSELIRALINGGKYDEALELLGDPADSFEWSMRLTSSSTVATSRNRWRFLTGEHPPEPDSDWARVSHIAGLPSRSD